MACLPFEASRQAPWVMPVVVCRDGVWLARVPLTESFLLRPARLGCLQLVGSLAEGCMQGTRDWMGCGFHVNFSMTSNACVSLPWLLLDLLVVALPELCCVEVHCVVGVFLHKGRPNAVAAVAEAPH